MTELLPTKGSFAPGEPVEVEVCSGHVRSVTLSRLGRTVAEVEPQGGIARFDPQPEGGYGVEAGAALGALDVLADPLSRARYGFVSDFTPGRSTEGVADNVRRLHLNAVQFYDWMYRHAKLLPPQETFTDALGRTVSLDTVRALAAAVTGAGAVPLGYAAVYAVGAEEWPQWQDEGLYRADGTPWTLADFLWNVDPSSERWLAHFTAELRDALTVGFAGFHLDQYGEPKRALRLDGRAVDLARAFPELINRVAAALPGARLIFNNVNDFPTWTTACANQDAVYVEVWPPHDRLAQLGAIVKRAQALAPRKAVVLATYLSPYAESEAAGVAAQRLLLATLFSHGASALLHGEEDAVLTEAYYVRHATVSPSAAEATCRWYDFAVRYGDLLFDRTAVDVTGSCFDGPNGELEIDAPVSISVDGRAGTLWVRVVEGEHGTLVHLIDLSPQPDDLWNRAKQPGRTLDGARLRVRRVSSTPPTVRFADPDGCPSLRTLPTASQGRYDEVELPGFETWALVWLPR